jgi:hypothetical protein
MPGPKRSYGMSEKEADARAVNAQPWEPPPGMLKRQCPNCRYFFAAPSVEHEAMLLCPDCAAAGTRTAAAEVPSISSFSVTVKSHLASHGVLGCVRQTTPDGRFLLVAMDRRPRTTGGARAGG